MNEGESEGGSRGRGSGNSASAAWCAVRGANSADECLLPARFTARNAHASTSEPTESGPVFARSVQCRNNQQKKATKNNNKMKQQTKGERGGRSMADQRKGVRGAGQR